MLSAFLDGRVFGERTGDGPATILAMHGWGRTRADLVEVLHDRPAICIDLPGFGASPAPERPLTTAEYAALVAPLLNELAPPRTVLGHSFGGRVAVQLAATHDAVDRLVLVGTPLIRREPPRPSWRYRAVRWAARRRLVPESVLERRRERSGSADYRAAQGVMRDVLVRAVNESYEEQLRQVRCPTVVVAGAYDTAAPPDLAREAVALLRHGTLSVVPGAAHLLDDALAREVHRQLDRGACPD